MSSELIQGSQEWLQARVGSLGASRVADAIARTKTGWGASRANLGAELVLERITGRPASCFVNDAMRRGTEMEPLAREAYEAAQGVEVVQVGIIVHPEIPGTHASPDGLVEERGLVELKCPTSATHMETLLTGQFPARYVTQCLWQMACTGREWVDLVSFDDRFPENMQLHIQRVPRDVSLILELEHQVSEFLAEIDAKVSALQAKFGSGDALGAKNPLADAA